MIIRNQDSKHGEPPLAANADPGASRGVFEKEEFNVLSEAVEEKHPSCQTAIPLRLNHLLIRRRNSMCKFFRLQHSARRGLAANLRIQKRLTGEKWSCGAYQKRGKLSNLKVIHGADVTDNSNHIGARPRVQAWTINLDFPYPQDRLRAPQDQPAPSEAAEAAVQSV
jgi:hypothetical protein